MQVLRLESGKFAVIRSKRQENGVIWNARARFLTNPGYKLALSQIFPQPDKVPPNEKFA